MEEIPCAFDVESSLRKAWNTGPAIYLRLYYVDMYLFEFDYTGKDLIWLSSLLKDRVAGRDKRQIHFLAKGNVEIEQKWVQEWVELRVIVIMLFPSWWTI
jgi:hypothetical protein